MALLAAAALPLAAADHAAAAIGAGATIDPRLGAPFEQRERAVLGSDTAGVVVIEVSSFKCAHCRTFHEKIFPSVRERYIKPGKVQWVVLNASDDPSDEFSPIFAIARCALRQGKYWELLDGLFSVAHRAPSFLTDLVAKSPLIDRGELEICLRDRTVRNAVAADFAEYARLKTKGTPTFLVRKLGATGQMTETMISGAPTLEYIQRVLDEMLRAP
ncbi:MAG: hypothetical protein EXS37_20665 [Opitutus sp.]|nr:hypothetical protein [Opitutus sp.]